MLVSVHTAYFVSKYFGRLKREEEAKIPLLSCTESFSFTRLNKYPEQFRQNFVNPLKICKIRVGFGCSYCSHSEVRVGCCFTQWVRCIPIVSIANVTLIPEMHTAHKTPTKNVSCEDKATSVQRFE